MPMEWSLDRNSNRMRRLWAFEAAGAIGTPPAAKARRSVGGLPKKNVCLFCFVMFCFLLYILG